ncbi:MAG: hypothetical protein H0T89_16350 [Deltaproteobacteria bacterium]|nr:hypothetical protein [Deltaproteobacteria bacterium]MDQ3301114.1 hypothetical protein [Myxococcota bacterium]
MMKLGNLPPAHHVVLLKHGKQLTKLRLERRAFTVEQAKVYAGAVAGRAKP